MCTIVKTSAENLGIDQTHKERFGGWNNHLPNMRQIEESDLIKGGMITYIRNPSLIEQRQFTSPFITNEKVKLYSVTAYYDSTLRNGIVLAPDYYTGKVYYLQFKWEYVHPCPLESDSGWKLTYNSSCIKDYSRVLKFERELSNAEIEDVKYWLVSDNCPGWTPITFIKNNTMYEFKTTMDSSG
jgi:hypothetical protein